MSMRSLGIGVVVLALGVGAFFGYKKYNMKSTVAVTETDKVAPEVTSERKYKDPVAKVDGEAISGTKFEQRVKGVMTRFSGAGRPVSPMLQERVEQGVLRSMMDDVLIAKQAKAQGVSVEPKDLEAAIVEHKGRVGGEEGFQEFLKGNQLTLADFSEMMSGKLLRDKLMAKSMPVAEPTVEEMQKHYNDAKERYKQLEEVRSSHILLKFTEGMKDEEKKKLHGEIIGILAKAKAKGADFAELAKKYSQCPSAPQGGDLGWFSRGRMVKEFEEASFNAKTGQIVGPIETQFGYHIIKVQDRKPEHQRSFDEAKGEIVAEMKSGKEAENARTFIETMRQNAKTEILDQTLIAKKEEDKKPAQVTPPATPAPSAHSEKSNN